MKTLFLVKQEEGDMARHMETKLLNLPLDSGVLFAGVSVVPSDGTHPTIFRVWVGCHRDFDESLMGLVVCHALREEIQQGVQVKVEAHRGLSRRALTEVR